MSMINVAGTAKSNLTNVQSEDVQPNAIDLRLGMVLEVDGSRPFVIGGTRDGKEIKDHRGSFKIEPHPYFTADGNDTLYFKLEKGKCYEVIMSNEVAVAMEEAGWTITRSTLNRNGVFITSGLYDSGYEGCMAGCLHNPAGDTYIALDARVAQYVCVEAEALHGYDGDYGKGKAHDQKYA